MPKYYEISEETARRSHTMTHMSDYIAGSATAGYRAAVDEAAALVEAQKKRVSPFYHDKLDALLDRYARRLSDWTNAHNRNGASCPSVLVAGFSNFPTHKKEKQNAREDTLWREYQEIQGILDKIRSVGTGAIDFSDPHARELLAERLETAKAQHETKKAANAYYRKHKTLDGCPGITEKTREFLTRPGVFYKPGTDGSPLSLYGVPFPSYDLQSDTAAIKRYAARLEEYDRLHSQDGPGADTEFDGGRVVRNVEQNRLQIIFDDIPDADTRTALKSEGFRWSPKNQAWQRQLTRNAEAAARRVLNIPAVTEPAATEPASTEPAAAPASDLPTAENGQYLMPQE